MFWFLDYFDMILNNNAFSEQRKLGPYETFTSITLDTENRKAKFYFHLDGDIFGVVVGAQYINISSLIKASFPVFSKIGMDIEVKVFPLGNTERRA